MKWNYLMDWQHLRRTHIVKNAAPDVRQEYEEARQDPKIVHFAGAAKPWTHGWIDLSEHFWSYARETPFYEAIIAGLSKRQAEANGSGALGNIASHERAVSEKSPLRQVIDPIAPIGSARREVLKSIGRGIRGRK